jgi:glycosyltransferase involved in cell wall biosynthesis
VTAGSPRLISVVLPVHNQAAHIGAIVESYREVLGQLGHPYEVVLSINGSRDDSADVCRTIAQANQQIVVISDPRAGWGLAV